MRGSRPWKDYPPIDRVLDRITVHPLGCWEFNGRLTAGGYGRVMVLGTPKRAHRLVYEDWFGPIPDGLVVDHLCMNPRCVNPSHLEVVTNEENLTRAAAARRAGLRDGRAKPAVGGLGHCRRGHLLDEANTETRQGRLRCRRCLNDAQNRRDRERRAKRRVK